MAESGRSKKTLELAARLGIDGAEQMGDTELTLAISMATATPEQCDLLRRLVTHLKLNYELPERITFGQAEKALNDIMPRANEGVLMDEGWTVGDILEWENALYRITAIHERNMKITLQPVEVMRLAPSSATIYDAPGKKKVHSPFALASKGAKKVDLS